MEPSQQTRGKPSGKQIANTTTEKFAASLHELIEELRGGKQFYVRCIKTNEANAPHPAFDENFVRAQLRSLNIVETVAMLASGFPKQVRFLVLSRFVSVHQTIISNHNYF